MGTVFCRGGIPTPSNCHTEGCCRPVLGEQTATGSAAAPNGLSSLLLMLRNFQLLEHAAIALNFYIGMSVNCRNALMRGREASDAS